MQNLHFLCQAPVLLAKTGRFRCIRLLPPPGFSRAERFDLKAPGLQLRAGDTRLPGNAALCRARFIKPLNRCCLILVRILPSMVSRLVPLSWTGVKYPGVRKQGRSSNTCWLIAAMMQTGIATRLKTGGSRHASRRGRAARSQSRTTKSAIGSATRSRTASPASRTGAASQHVTTPSRRCTASPAGNGCPKVFLSACALAAVVMLWL